MSNERILQRVTSEFLQWLSDFLQQATSATRKERLFATSNEWHFATSNERILQRVMSDFTTINEQQVNFNK